MGKDIPSTREEYCRTSQRGALENMYNSIVCYVDRYFQVIEVFSDPALDKSRKLNVLSQCHDTLKIWTFFITDWIISTERLYKHSHQDIQCVWVGRTLPSRYKIKKLLVLLLNTGRGRAKNSLKPAPVDLDGFSMAFSESNLHYLSIRTDDIEKILELKNKTGFNRVTTFSACSNLMP